MAQYEIYKRTTAGKRGTLIEEYTTFEAVLRFNEVGKWSLSSRGSSLCPFSENEGIIVYRNGVVLLSGYITNITEEADESYPESALITWNVEGLEDTGMLQRRIIYPDPVNLTFTTADFHTITDYAGNAILTYIDKHAGSGAHVDRKVPNLVIDALSNLGNSATYKGRFEVLWDFIIAIANTSDLGVRIVWDGSTGNAEAQVYEPSDKSTTVIFSRDFGNLKGWKRKRTAPSGNVIIAGGEGEGVDRLMSVVSDSASITKWGRIEQFLDSGVSTEQDDEDPRTPTQMNEDEATAKLTDSAATDGYELNIIDVDRMQYKTDWDLGDKVSIRIGNTSFTQNIKEVKITYAGTIEKITPSVGTIDKGNLATIFTALQETEARVTALEAKESAVIDEIAFETSASNIKADGAASVGSLSTIARADHVHPDDDSGWINITSFQNGWQVYTTWGGFVRYRKIGKIGVLYVNNLYNTSNLSARAGSILTIPAGYRYNGEVFGISVAATGGVKSVLRLLNGTLDNDTAYTANDKLILMLFYLIDS